MNSKFKLEEYVVLGYRKLDEIINEYFGVKHVDTLQYRADNGTLTGNYSYCEYDITWAKDKVFDDEDEIKAQEEVNNLKNKELFDIESILIYLTRIGEAPFAKYIIKYWW